MVYFLLGYDHHKDYNRIELTNKLLDSYKKQNYDFDNKLIIGVPFDLEIPEELNTEGFEIFRFQYTDLVKYSKYMKGVYLLNEFKNNLEPNDYLVFLEPDMIFKPYNNFLDELDSNKIYLHFYPVSEFPDLVSNVVPPKDLEKRFKIKIKYHSWCSGMIIPFSKKEFLQESLNDIETYLKRYKFYFKKFIGSSFSVEDMIIGTKINNDFEFNKFVYSTINHLDDSITDHKNKILDHKCRNIYLEEGEE
jgi:hypothetical protein